MRWRNASNDGIPSSGWSRTSGHLPRMRGSSLRWRCSTPNYPYGSASALRLNRPRSAAVRRLTHTGSWAWNIATGERSEEHTSELQSQSNLVCRLLLEKKKSKCENSAEQDKNQLQSRATLDGRLRLENNGHQ